MAFAPTLAVDGGAYGIGLASRLEFIAPVRRWVLLDRFDERDIGVGEPRVAQLAELRVGGVRICVVNTHVEWFDAALRARQLEVLLDDIDTLCARTSTVLLGDFNAVDSKLVIVLFLIFWVLCLEISLFCVYVYLSVLICLRGCTSILDMVRFEDKSDDFKANRKITQYY